MQKKSRQLSNCSKPARLSASNLVSAKCRNLVSISSSVELCTDSELIDDVNELSKTGIKVSLVCPPQSNHAGNLISILDKSVEYHCVPVHIPEAELFDLEPLLGRGLRSKFQRCLSLLKGESDYFEERLINKAPGFVRHIVRRVYEFKKVEIEKAKQNALETGSYWQFFLCRQLPPELYRKYKELLFLDCFGYFYFYETLLIRKLQGGIDTVICNDPYALPAGCLLKELLPELKLIYDSHMRDFEYVADPEKRRLLLQNQDWILSLCDLQILPASKDIAPLPVFEHRVPVRQAAAQANQSESGTLNIAILYDPVGTMTVAVHEYLNALRLYIPHEIFMIPASTSVELPHELDLSLFDAVILHYSIRICVDHHLDSVVAEKLAAYSGLKLLFIQDEYDFTEKARKSIEKLGFDLVYTCVPEDSIDLVYPASRFRKTEFINVLTGYVPEDSTIESFARPIEDRELDIVYRGRILPFRYGLLGYEKYEIGVHVKRLALERGLLVDIEVDDLKRIYGSGWYEFLASARACLGTESGSNVFDFDGKITESVKQELTLNPYAGFHEIEERILKEHEGPVHMNQVSPKIFEAIQLRTALILFEGRYSDVVQPDLHFIPLKKDFSNIEEVFQKLEDLDYLTELTDRAYNDVIASRKYSFKTFAKKVSSDIEARIGKRRGEISCPETKKLLCASGPDPLESV